MIMDIILAVVFIFMVLRFAIHIRDYNNSIDKLYSRCRDVEMKIERKKAGKAYYIARGPHTASVKCLKFAKEDIIDKHKGEYRIKGIFGQIWIPEKNIVWYDRQKKEDEKIGKRLKKEYFNEK